MLVDGAGEMIVYFILLHGKQTIFHALTALIRAHSPGKVPQAAAYDLIHKVKDDFLNWIVFNLNYTTKYACKPHLFERTLVADRRGLSREGRDIMASQGYMMKRTLYDQTLKQFLLDTAEAQR